MASSERQMKILAAVVEEYIKSGEPVGSHFLIEKLNLGISSATIRSEMATLERDGFLIQPHTSAGRIPTNLGYRFYIDNLMAPHPLTTKEKNLIDSLLINGNIQTADAVVENALSVLSDLTKLAVVSKSNMPIFSVITRVEVIPAGRRLYALLIITSSGTIKNKICRLEFDLTYEQLDYFAKFINQNLMGLNLDKLNKAMLQNFAVAMGTYMMSLSPLLHAVYELGEEIAQTNVNIKGEQNLLSQNGFKSDEVVTLMTHKNELDNLLSSAFDGISVVFGKENESFAITNSSMIMSPYKMHDENVGSFGVIGPVRVDYAKVIGNIEYISKSVTKLITNVIDENNENSERTIK